MANKRMFSKQIVDSDAFLDMPATSQLLYFHLNMQADDDGFVGNPKKVIRMMGASEDDFKILVAKRFILTFDSGVMVVKHWKLHNYIQNDRYHETQYLEEKSTLITKENGVYTDRIQDVSKVLPEVRLGKDRLDKVSLDESGNKSPTPAQEAKDFFSNKEKQLEILIALQNKFGQIDLMASELKKFIEYWTEPNKSGTKQRWELQSTFEIRRRITTWLNNIKQFNQIKKEKGTLIL